jgi:hypothetical protein
MSEYSEFFLNSKSKVVQLELLEIYHPNFSKRYYIVRNAVLGVTVKHEDGTTHAYQYYPCKLEQNSTEDDLDAGYKITWGELGEIVPTEMDRVRAANGFLTKPTIIYRSYRSDNLNTVMFGPILLEAVAFTFTLEGSAFEANAPQMNQNSVGEIYDLVRFDALRGTL